MHRPKRHKTAILLRPSTCAEVRPEGAGRSGPRRGSGGPYIGLFLLGLMNATKVLLR